MSNQGEVITKNRIGFEKSNKALGFLYKEWYGLISKFLSKVNGINIELGCGASFIDEIIKSVKKSDVFLNSNTDLKIDAMEVGLRFENKISKKKYFDSVHKIKIMTSIEILKKLNLELQHL